MRVKGTFKHDDLSALKPLCIPSTASKTVQKIHQNRLTHSCIAPIQLLR